MEEHVATRSSTQARSHAQKFFYNVSKRNLSMEEFLNRLDLSKIKEDYVEGREDLLMHSKSEDNKESFEADSHPGFCKHVRQRKS